MPSTSKSFAAGELALACAKALNDPEAAVGWTHLFGRCLDAGSVSAGPCGSIVAWFECSLDDIAAIRYGDLQRFLESGTIRGGEILFFWMAVSRDPKWMMRETRKVMKRSTCVLVATERPDGRLHAKRLR